MSGYRDRGWCSASDQCGTEGCGRKVTDEVRYEAAAFYGGPEKVRFMYMDYSTRCDQFVRKGTDDQGQL